MSQTRLREIIISICGANEWMPLDDRLGGDPHHEQYERPIPCHSVLGMPHIALCRAKIRKGTPCRSLPVEGRKRCQVHHCAVLSSPA